MKFDYVRYDGTPAACDIDVHRREGFTLVVVSEEDGHRFGGIRESAEELALWKERMMGQTVAVGG